MKYASDPAAHREVDFYGELVRQSHEVFFAWNAVDGQVAYISPSYETVWGRTCESLYQNPREWFTAIHPDDQPKMQHFIAMEQSRIPAASFEVEYRILRPDGTIRWIRARGLPAMDGRHLLGTAEDVTERRKLEDQFRQAQKMEAVGRLAGGVAHDFNNLLTAILGYSNLVLERLDAPDPLREDVEEIRKAGERAATLTRQLLAFSRKQVLKPKLANLNTLVGDMEKMLDRVIGEDVELVVRLQEDPDAVLVDVGQIEQAIMNLAVNARDAMTGGGRLILETGNTTFEEAHRDIPAGEYVTLSVTDTGTGMTDEVKARLFEPFFTTKEVGKGTGLGLSTVHGIVRQSEGYLTVYSEVGKGTTFRIFLPRQGDAPEKGTRSVPVAPAQRCSGTILVVEDESSVRALVRTVLRRLGYTVLEASNGVEALLICEGSEPAIDLVLSDVVMPKLDGPELLERLGKIRPGLRRVLMSGYTELGVHAQRHRMADIAFIQKPFSPGALASKVREVLDAPHVC